MSASIAGGSPIHTPLTRSLSEAPKPSQQMSVTGHAQSGSPLGGSQIQATSLPSGSSVGSQQAERLQHMDIRGKGAAVAHLFGALVDTIKTGLSLGRLANHEATFPSETLRAAQKERQDLRDTLGAPDTSRPGILDKTVDVKGRSGVTVGELINDSRVNQLGGDKRISQSEMNTYIRMGEQIVNAVKASPDGKTPLEVTVNGQKVEVRSNLETTRAVGWYLHAKAISDNADGAHAPATTGKSGAMVAADPGNKIYNFLRANDGCYGRTSTHMEKQSASRSDMRWAEAYSKSGLVSAGAIAKGGALQMGIEDFHDKMPGGGGTLLFDKLLPDSSGSERLYIKFEPVGVPNSFGFRGKHMDEADGFAEQMRGLANAGLRNVSHGANLFGSIKAKMFSSEEGYRGEKVDKGPTKATYKAFQAELKSADWIDDGMRKEMAADVKKYGATAMKSALEDLIDLAPAGHPAVERLQATQTQFEALLTGLGADLGMDRTGNELHVRP